MYRVESSYGLYSPLFTIFSIVHHLPITSFSFWSIRSFTILQRRLKSACVCVSLRIYPYKSLRMHVVSLRGPGLHGVETLP